MLSQGRPVALFNTPMTSEIELTESGFKGLRTDLNKIITVQGMIYDILNDGQLKYMLDTRCRRAGRLQQHYPKGRGVIAEIQSEGKKGEDKGQGKRIE